MNNNRSITEQEGFWAGSFGNDYIDRNANDSVNPAAGNIELAGNIYLFSKIWQHVRGVNSVIEFGANIGHNLDAINHLAPGIHSTAVEINPRAVSILKTRPYIKEVYYQSIIDFSSSNSYDLSFTKGVLIHLAPELLNSAYEIIYNASNKYVLFAEYYNPTPVEIKYRGHNEKLYKRDFAGEFLDLFRDCRLINYGFIYRGDPNFFQDDLTWFLISKY